MSRCLSENIEIVSVWALCHVCLGPYEVRYRSGPECGENCTHLARTQHTHESRVAIAALRARSAYLDSADRLLPPVDL